MRIRAIGAFAVVSIALCGCVDPAHSRFASKGPCEVSVGSHICTNGDDSDGSQLTANGDPSLRQVPGAIGGRR